MTTTIARRDTTASAVTAALLGALTLVVLVRLALHSQRGQSWDQSAMETVTAGRDARLTMLSLLGYVGIGSILAVVAACIVVSVLRGRFVLALAAVAVVAGANVTTQVLKHVVLDRPDVGLGLGTLNSLPSGHTTVVASAVGASLLVAPRAWRPLVALGGGLATTMTGASTVVAGWHRPSDVVAALAVSLAWTAAVALVVRGPATPIAGTTAGAVVGCGAALLALVAIGVRPVMGWDGFVGASLVLGLVTAATAAFVVAAASTAPGD